MNAVVYCRYSTDNQTENSIMYQMNAAQEYANKHNMTIIEVYSDEAQTGTNIFRNGLQRLLKDCDTGKFQAVIIYDQARLSRNVVDWFTLREQLNSKNITLCSCCQNLNNNILDSSSFLCEGVQAIFNEVHVLETRKKTIEGVTAKAKRAEFCGGKPPLGYDIIDGKYVINENESSAIKLIFEMYANGYSYGDIQELLNQKGYRSKNGKVISKNALYYLLINERYTGVYSWNKYQCKQMRKRITRRDNPNSVRIEDSIPPIISKDTYERVKKRMSENKRGTNKAKHDYLLSGKIICGKCGNTYTGFASKSTNGGENIYYTCNNKYRTNTCDAKNIRADVLEKAVYDILRQDYLTPEMIEATAEHAMNNMGNNKQKQDKIKKEIAKRKNAINNLLKSIEDGLSTQSTIDRINEIQDEISGLESRLNECVAADSNKLTKKQIIDALNRDVEMLDGDPKQQKAVIQKYVEKIILTGDDIDVRLIGEYSDNTGGATQT